MSFKTDAEIAQSSTMRPIGEIAAKLGLNVDNIEPYGHYKAKINPAEAFKLPQKQGRLILVTAINPTPAGEGKNHCDHRFGGCFAPYRQRFCYRPARAFFGSGVWC